MDYEELKAAEDRAGEGVNTYIKKAVRMRMETEDHIRILILGF